jgi:hypothetical protein
VVIVTVEMACVTVMAKLFWPVDPLLSVALTVIVNEPEAV